MADAAVIGSLVIALVCVQLWTRFAIAAAYFGLGLLALVWAQRLTLHGIALPLAALIALATLAIVLWACKRRIRPVNAALQIEALLIVLAAAVVVAAVPAVNSGWHSAAALNAVAQTPATNDIPGGGLALLLICVAPLVLGAAYSVWRRRRRC